MLHRRFKLIYLSGDLTRKVEVSLTRNKVKLAIAGLAVLFLIVNVTVGVVASRVVTSHDNQALEQENRRLREHLMNFDSRLGSVGEELSGLAETDNMLRLMADLPMLDADVRAVGVGGTVTEPILESAIPRVNDVSWTLNKLDREIELQRASFEEIHDKLISNSEFLEHIPTLRPLEGGYFSSSFGMRRDPFTKKRSRHEGIDYCAPRGTPVIAAAGGRVAYAGRYYNYGKFVVIDHGSGYETAYGHLNSIKVRKGQRISKGDLIATVGSTGRSTAPHLHYEVRVNGQPVNPMDYVFDEVRRFPTMAHSGSPRYN